MSYTVFLEGKQLKRNQITGMHLMVSFILIGMGMVTWLVPDSVKQTSLQFLNYVGLSYVFLGLAILVVSIFFNKKIIQTKANTVLRIVEIFAVAVILLYSFTKKWYLPLGYSGAALLGIILAYYFEQNHKKDKKAFFDENGVHIPGLGRHSHTAWQDIKNIIIKHNILTVDFMDNKLYQGTLSTANNSIDKAAFADYCQNHIATNKEKFTADW